MEEKDGRERGKTHRENAIRIMAVAMCLTVGIEPVDSLDGSSNWWMFSAEAEKIVDDLWKRFPAAPETVECALDHPPSSGE